MYYKTSRGYDTVQWDDEEKSKSASDITVNDVLLAIKNYRKQAKEIRAKNIRISCPGTTFSMDKRPISDLIGAKIKTKYSENDTMIKKGSEIYRLSPDHQIHLLENRLFIRRLKNNFCCTLDDEHRRFPLFWNLEGKMLNDSKRTPFRIEECFEKCSKIKNDTVDKTEGQMQELKRMLCGQIEYVSSSGNNNFYQGVQLNCSILKNTPFKKFSKQCTNLDSILLEKDRIDKSTLGNNKNAEDLLKELQKPAVVCNAVNDNELQLSSPYLTKTHARKLKGFICLERLIQFLRMKCPLVEGEYNELYHLSNCECHNNGWSYIVGDRVLIGTQKIELFDVMAYKEGENCYMYHVKEGSNASASRAACSQVTVCAKEVGNANLFDESGKHDIYDLFYEAACNTRDDQSIHRSLVKERMEKVFGSKESFKKKMKSITGDRKFKIVLALASKDILTWHNAKNVDLEKNLEPLFSSNKELLAGLKRGNVISEKNQITQKLFDYSKEKMLKLFQDHRAVGMYDEILNFLGSSSSFNLRNFLTSTSYITKCTINQLSNTFMNLQCVDMNVELMILAVDNNLK